MGEEIRALFETIKKETDIGGAEGEGELNEILQIKLNYERQTWTEQALSCGSALINRKCQDSSAMGS